ncbi:hypothetical protein [Helicobacter trogontum]|uniref:Uncharacterized protein n=1 Tax=Helicobacter trogontum TaxID=50960 RepID=A0A4U8TE35_9HELI|nr:hypothetical protein [Helicobacter trogontum]MCI5786110.1 hypothetical protein [Helicobacter trogontum]MDY5185540.1 hypothetical protein [Helicobacter trogontum]TLD98153.1 hypothetical protein LS80_005925 [Helicobacter trogontum]
MSNSNKEMINKFKDYADIADASYAMLDLLMASLNIAHGMKKIKLNGEISNCWAIGLKEQIRIQPMPAVSKHDLCKILS